MGLAHHWMVSMRGGEKTLAVLADMFPGAPIHTLLARPEQLAESITSHPIVTSWLQRWSRVPDLQRKAIPLLARAARSLDATRHDVVICSDAALIKAIRTRPDALKLCYCHSPMRYVWDLYDAYYAAAGPVGRLGLRWFAPSLRRADRAAADTVTAFVANSRCVAERIERCYGRPSVVIPPPVEVDFPPAADSPDDFYLVVSELVAYKRVDLAVEACTRLGRPLSVIGTGPLMEELRRRAGPTVRLLGWQSDEVVREHLRRCRALLFCGEEDFGMVPVEAQAAGRPVIAYRAGGALETVLEGRTGLFFDEPAADALIETIRRFESGEALAPPCEIQAHARRFSVESFRQRFGRYYDWCIEQYRQGGVGAVREAMALLERDAFGQEAGGS